MEKEPQLQQPDDFDKEAAKFWEDEKERAVKDLQEALRIDQSLKLFMGYLEKGILNPDMPLGEALEKLEKKKFELTDTDPEEAEEAEEIEDEDEKKDGE
ncbi:MAG: hypothetical protein A2931_03370 [Candidatus Niyogibacteria bacterium RIFCSPLOWO2_01_FULL_45_48]|uniref:Uncharacterized protein n=1 Tax=Candidatus Niyogibacteria bacterium RIFCSPLOWO2_01_FULL_45_48 TaxID=1801724 RepID=A0A1G2EUC9_9BACT|nr:MAG: hypothetical protein A2931_03370 [Candidatus Niyogibacteria bacterium RIFCSPLOWO2_01_FULL_45_48]OHB17097.1 MAG: hypothetical protein A2734_01535 [Parcubacteria group bacterium RIFCSPHIGHO2_01_FULL_40_30]